MDRLKSDYAFTSLTNDESATCKALLEKEPSSSMLLMPTHHISTQGDMTGFRYECRADCKGDVLPISRTMFFGHTAVECMDGDASIMRLLADHENNRVKMREFLNILQSSYNPPDLDCIPDNSATLTQSGLIQSTQLRSMDCKPWVPEIPESIGLYHAYIRGYNRDVRTHKLFAICSGGCAKASDQFCNLVIDVGREWTAGEVSDSEEAWWLRKACQRSRCRLLKMLADHFEVKIQSVDDIMAHPDTRNVGFKRHKHSSALVTEYDLIDFSPNYEYPAPINSSKEDTHVAMAVPSTDTVEHDMVRRDGRYVTVHNACVDTTRITNGILCQMHPAEGVWLFRGAPRGTGVYGAMFGSQATCRAFPTRAPVVEVLSRASARTHDGSCIVRAEATSEKRGERHMCFDEAFFKNLERMQWNRDNGYVELIPIIVGLG